MTHDFTYLNQLGVVDLLDRAHRGNWTGPEAHMIRALAERLEEHLDAVADYDAINAALMDANQRAEALEDELNNWKSIAEALNGRVKELTY
jgi:NTP pyrophosphatase (non-canonical NTP hydrolase)